VERGRPRTRTVDDREEDRSGTVVCTATLEVDAVIETDSAFFGQDCAWGNVYAPPA
jgi:hypothetical protein